MDNVDVNKRNVAEELYTKSVGCGFDRAYKNIIAEVTEAANNGLQEYVISHPMFASVKTVRLDNGDTEGDVYGPDYTPPQKRMVERLQEDGFVVTSIGGNFNGRNLRINFDQTP